MFSSNIHQRYSDDKALHCVMVRFDDEEWNKFLTMYEESQVYAKWEQRTE